MARLGGKDTITNLSPTSAPRTQDSYTTIIPESQILTNLIIRTTLERDCSSVALPEVSSIFFPAAKQIQQFFPHLNRGSEDGGCCSLYRL